jgi:hypothetical protein
MLSVVVPPVLLSTIRLGWKSLPGTNTLTYGAHVSHKANNMLRVRPQKFQGYSLKREAQTYSQILD